MRAFRRFATLTVAGIGVLMLVGPAAAQPTADEVKCELAVGGNILGTFVKKKAGCIAKCQKKTPGSTDCDPSYGGPTQTCVQTAETQASAKIAKKCTKDCPECYSGGNCTTESTTRVSSVEGQIDGFVTLIFCNYGSNTADQQKCQLNLEKRLATFVKKKARIAATCVKKNGSAGPACTPPPSDSATATAIAKLEAKTAALIDKGCGGANASEPSCGANPCPNNPSCYVAPFQQNGTGWTGYTETSVDGNYASIYCEN